MHLTASNFLITAWQISITMSTPKKLAIVLYSFEEAKAISINFSRIISLQKMPLSKKFNRSKINWKVRCDNLLR